jgi:hypothetical protein
VIAQKVFQLLEGRGVIAISAAINNVQTLIGVRVIEVQLVNRFPRNGSRSVWTWRRKRYKKRKERCNE